MKGWPGEPDMEYDVLMADGEAAVNAGKPITDVIFDFCVLLHPVIGSFHA